MKRVIISEKGNIGFINGPGARNISMVFTDEEGKDDKPKEEIDASAVGEKAWKKWKKEKDPKKVLKEIRKELA